MTMSRLHINDAMRHCGCYLDGSHTVLTALSIHQPWANMIADGEKAIEVRCWSTSYRGPLLICSTKKNDVEPRGCGVALATLVDCRPMTESDEDAACCVCDVGDIAWVLDRVLAIQPFPVRGQRSLFSVRVTNLPSKPVVHQAMFDYS